MVSTPLKNISQIGSFPQVSPGRDENKKYLKPPPRDVSGKMSAVDLMP